MSPIQAAELVIKTSNAGNRWNHSVMRNSGRIDGVVSVDAPSMNDEQQKQMQQKFQAMYGGADNVGKQLFLTRWAKYTKIGNTPMELDWKSSEGVVARKICNVMGVPSQLLGDPETSKYSNYKEARKALYQDTSLPLIEHLVDELNWWLVPRYDQTGNIRIVTDTAHIEVLRDDENSLFGRMAQATWLTPNEKRVACGYAELEDDENADKLQNTNPFAGIDGLASDTVTETHDDLPVLEHVNKNSKYQTQEARDNLVEMRDRQRVPFVKQYQSIMQEYWREQESLILNQFDSETRSNNDSRFSPSPKEQHHTDPDLFSKVNDEFEQDAELAKRFKPMTVRIVARVGQNLLDEMGKSGLLFDVDRPDIQRWVADDIAMRSRLINKTTGKQLRALIKQANEEGVGAVETRYRIQEMFDTIGKVRAIAIARTETVRAQSKGTLEAFDQGGVEYTEWVSARDDRVRESHQEPLDGTVVRVGENFPVVNAPAPGLSADPAESINCRCVLAPLETPEDAI